MQNFLFAIILVLLFILFSKCGITAGWFKPRGISSIDQMKYTVMPFPDKNKAADTLATLNKRAGIVLGQLKKDYPTSQIVRNLRKRLNPDVLVEHFPSVLDSNVAYTSDKGRTINICLRDMKTGKIHDINTLTFVMLHEISHLATDVKHHPREFWKVFKVILDAAIRSGAYDLQNYREVPVSYCNGMNINYSPYFDKTLDSPAELAESVKLNKLF